MTFGQILFILFGLVTIIAAVMVVVRRNLFHAALFLVLSFFGVAALYVLLEAYFFAAAQVLVYVGAISILIIFAVMLTRGVMGGQSGNSQWREAAVICGILLVGLVGLLSPVAINFLGRNFGGLQWRIAGGAAGLPVVSEQILANLGMGFVDLNQYALPFVLSGVLILLAMVGAIWVARERHPAEVLAERKQIAAELAADAAAEAITTPEVAPTEQHAH
ncbi:MAG TPA: NADH-quinone oxidoreductase subunit J [Thermoflexales bacterium]|nr:NADH-quinone oxidoreductase subunit J [Thermoflexales bacterium]HQW36336.1 NADH-quinone oxidoreductase subunit J [Thermoflexales bacterium]HQZ21172.1 NADH-quinone oxidoreductase subunit J [Thermoflexales bacterium]HQZ98859.1 NADH-quinone oxidoreductase subunit J [Thermoflexales bacterium]